MLLRPHILHPPATVVRLRHCHLPQRQWHSPSAPWPRRSHRQNPSHRPHNTPSSRRPFSTSPPTNTQAQTHYEALGVDPTISAPALKKRFYTLSREHHPDLHPSDPAAVQRFQQISESYSILSDPEKRKRYDRDVLRLHHQHHRQHEQRGGTYAGSRAPTGLSRRSSAFRGPPPSYFAQGQGGAYEPGRNPYTRGPDGEAAHTAAGGGAGAGSGAGSSATGEATAEFDSRGVYRTQTHEDRKRNARRAAAMAAAQAAAEEDGDFWARFVIVSCVLLASLTIGSLFVGDTSNTRRAGGMVKADGTRRENGKKAQ